VEFYSSRHAAAPQEGPLPKLERSVAQIANDEAVGLVCHLKLNTAFEDSGGVVIESAQSTLITVGAKQSFVDSLPAMRGWRARNGRLHDLAMQVVVDLVVQELREDM
jgi:hypothetical protein